MKQKLQSKVFDPLQAMMRSRLLVSILAASGVIFTIAVAHALYRLEVDNQRLAFEQQVENYSVVLQRELQAGIEAVYAMKEVIRHGGDLSEDVFADVASSILGRNAYILSLEWVPLVPSDERKQFEQSKQDYLPGYVIRELDTEGQLSEAPERDLYAPASFVFPRYTNFRVIGFDMLTRPLRAEAMARARDTGTLALSAPIDLVLRARQGKGLLMALPVYEGNPSNQEQRMNSLRGYVFAVFESLSLGNRLLEADMAERYLLLEDATNTAIVHTLYEKNEPAGLPLHSVTLRALGGRYFRFTMNAGSDFESIKSTPLPWVAMLVGLGSVVIVYGYLLMIQRRSLVVEKQVATRTAQLQLANEKLEKLTMTDPLTGLANRRALDNFLANEWARAGRDGLTLSVVMLDVDYFKKVNDQYGHDVGDECLKILAREMKHFFRRAGDLLARFGGEEFAIVMPNTDGAVYKRINEFRAHISSVPIPLADDGELKITLSAGLASALPVTGLEVADLLRAADESLYEAKAGGRNQVRQVKNVLPQQEMDSD